MAKGTPFAQLAKKSNAELQKELSENRERLLQLRFDLIAGKVKNVREIRKIKLHIARILTALKEKK